LNLQEKKPLTSPRLRASARDKPLSFDLKNTNQKHIFSQSRRDAGKSKEKPFNVKNQKCLLTLTGKKSFDLPASLRLRERQSL